MPCFKGRGYEKVNFLPLDLSIVGKNIHVHNGGHNLDHVHRNSETSKKLEAEISLGITQVEVESRINVSITSAAKTNANKELGAGAGNTCHRRVGVEGVSVNFARLRNLVTEPSIVDLSLELSAGSTHLNS